ncbi:hypothetical protein GT037_008442 [Alternaria burnsii]|uniref:Fungal N-terminal domain-containing protein n=1 Tax=Alternaria burnsii TaxID=1187904 RepID=A0A8H7EDN9_9PLEO|nr:uncharacterized protein GT037_008442 [Alternaria burnsii]KAF7673827.1 hypothetical protein GT037_008442 [Alternaria burnsii]
MAEVAGTIFGVISLSIQLFDKFNTYTNSVKDARRKAEQITGELDILVSLLENLETIVSRLDPTTSTALTRNSIQECARAVEVIRSRLGDAPAVKGSVRFWTRSRNVIKRLTYPFKESDIKYWKDVLASIQQSLQTALLASQTDQQQRYFTTLQAQLDQLSLNTSAGIQMILDQQRHAKSLAEQTIGQHAGVEVSSYRRHEGSVQFFLQDYDRSSTQNTSFDSHSQISSKTGRRHVISGSLLPISAIDLEEDITDFRNIERRIRPNRLQLRKKPGYMLDDDDRYAISPMDGSHELVKLFQTRKASPHDRLRNGTTLLHYFCMEVSFRYRIGTLPYDIDKYRSVADHLLRYMSYADASDTDDDGRTCLDFVVRVSKFDHRYVPFVTDLLQHGLKISPKSYPIDYIISWNLLPFSEFPDSFIGCSDATVAALLRSEADFSKLVQRGHPEEVSKQEEGSELYKLVTQMGWVRGCQILVDTGFRYATQVPEGWGNGSDDLGYRCLLFKALYSRNQEMVKFWLGKREHATKGYLTDIGNLQSALVWASETSEANMAEILLTNLVEQRSWIQETLELYGVECECAIRSKGLLDTHTTCALRALDEQGFEPLPSFRPTFENIYSVEMIYNSIFLGVKDPLPTLNSLYDAGFTDIAKVDIKCRWNDPPSPLHIAIKCYSYYGPWFNSLSKFFEMVDWFLSKGADLTDCWPRSRITTLHFISAKAATLFNPSVGQAISEGISDNVADLFQHTLIDDCECTDESEFPRQPLKRYLPDDSRRIQEEDAHLVVILEEMVPLFDARYDTHEGDLQSFVDKILLPEVEIMLHRLKQEDEALYADERRDMGVVMVNE